METPPWYWDELAHAGSEHLDAAYVATYDQKASTDPTEDLAVLREQGLQGTHLLVDLGAGTGTFSLAVAPHCRRVIAVDVSAVMLTTLHQKATSLGIENIECVPGGFLTYEHQGELVDVVYSRHALHHLPDFWKTLALQRIAAILKPGGVLLLRDLVISCEPQDIDRIVGRWLANAAAQPEHGWTRAELETHLREEYSTFSWLLEPMIAHAGFQIRQALHADSRMYSTYVCIKQG